MMFCAVPGPPATQPTYRRSKLMANKSFFLLSCLSEVFCHSNGKQEDTDGLGKLCGQRKVRVTLQRKDLGVGYMISLWGKGRDPQEKEAHRVTKG